MSDDAKNSFALHRHTTTVPVNADGTPKKEPNRLTLSTEEEKRAARTKILWEAKGHGKGAWLDYRPNEPHRIQVKIGADDSNLIKLKRLDRLISATRAAGWIFAHPQVRQVCR